MSSPLRPIAYVLASTNHGSMIVNRNDQAEYDSGDKFGVGFQLLTRSAFDPEEVNLALMMLTQRRNNFGPGVVAIDGGANIGVHTLEWSRHMHGWGRVLSFEAQEYVYYALAGNIALNNCWNASARWMALGEQVGHIDIPQPDYLSPGSFGSLELRPRPQTEFIGQEVSYDLQDCVRTPMTSIDALELERLDFIKIDVEGMEADVLRGARATLQRCRPIVMAEMIKSNLDELVSLLDAAGYHVITEGAGLNLVALHESDPARQQIRVVKTEVPAGG
ncbi:FkbM family methyltransferase [Ramlibacter montanisoli]|uniref:FkbM family methyltransferase n=1 Tax=Ramlibacter montanisoli TaxID=2732512 RepID=A0A849K9F4_9BURK|nr:FkbM family methyltransferase [Ramlibacter montanisoli]NNU44958.1 FkbM family methyltransferase [Ramlibacter montanisoli]